MTDSTQEGMHRRKPSTASSNAASPPHTNVINDGYNAVRIHEHCAADVHKRLLGVKSALSEVSNAVLLLSQAYDEYASVLKNTSEPEVSLARLLLFHILWLPNNVSP